MPEKGALLRHEPVVRLLLFLPSQRKLSVDKAVFIFEPIPPSCVFLWVENVERGEPVLSVQGHAAGVDREQRRTGHTGDAAEAHRQLPVVDVRLRRGRGRSLDLDGHRPAVPVPLLEQRPTRRWRQAKLHAARLAQQRTPVGRPSQDRSALPHL